MIPSSSHTAPSLVSQPLSNGRCYCLLFPILSLSSRRNLEFVDLGALVAEPGFFLGEGHFGSQGVTPGILDENRASAQEHRQRSRGWPATGIGKLDDRAAGVEIIFISTR